MTNSLPTAVPNLCFTTPGPCDIWVSTGATLAMEHLGCTRGGVSITEQVFLAEAKSDLSGGEQGPPADFQFLGEAHSMDSELAQYDPAILAKLARRVNVGVTTRTKGMLIGCSGGFFRVLFLSLNFVRNYTKVFINEPITMPQIGTNILYPRLNFFGLEDAANTDSKPWNTNYTAGSDSIT